MILDGYGLRDKEEGMRGHEPREPDKRNYRQSLQRKGDLVSSVYKNPGRGKLSEGYRRYYPANPSAGFSVTPAPYCNPFFTCTRL